MTVWPLKKNWIKQRQKKEVKYSPFLILSTGSKCIHHAPPPLLHISYGCPQSLRSTSCSKMFPSVGPSCLYFSLPASKCACVMLLQWLVSPERLCGGSCHSPNEFASLPSLLKDPFLPGFLFQLSAERLVLPRASEHQSRGLISKQTSRDAPSPHHPTHHPVAHLLNQPRSVVCQLNLPQTPQEE